MFWAKRRELSPSRNIRPGKSAAYMARCCRFRSAVQRNLVAHEIPPANVLRNAKSPPICFRRRAIHAHGLSTISGDAEEARA
jgi:hypothetical protein